MCAVLPTRFERLPGHHQRTMSVSLSGLAAFHRLDSTSSSDSVEAQALVRGFSSDIPKLTIPGVEKVCFEQLDSMSLMMSCQGGS